MTLDVHATPREIKLAGKTYRITPLRRRELAEFVAWCQDSEFAAARRQAEGLPEEDRRSLLAGAWERVAGYSLSHPAVMQKLVTPEGAARALWLGLRHEHPDLSEDDLFEALAATGSDQRTMLEAMEAIDLATGGAPGSPRGGGKKKPKVRRRQSR